MNEKREKNLPWLMYVVVPSIPLIAAGNYSFYMNAEVGLFVWEFLALLLCVGVLIFRSATLKDFYREPAFIAVSAFVLWILSSIGWSVVFHDALFESLRYFSGFLLLVAILVVRPNDTQARRLLTLLFAASGLAALYGIYQGVWGFSEMLKFAIANDFSAGDIRLLRETQRPFGTFFHTNAFAGYLAAMIPLGALAFTSFSQKILRGSITAALVAIITALLFTSSRGGWLCACVVLLPLVIFMLKQHGLKTSALFMASVLLAIGVYAGLLHLSDLPSEGESVASPNSPIERVGELTGSNDLSKSSRLMYWQTAFRMGLDYQPLGAGLGAYEHASRQYLSVPTYSRNPHNVWLQFFAETGVIGLLLFLLTLVFMMLSASRLFKYGGANGRTAFYILLSAAAMLMHASFDLDFDGPAVVLSLFALAGFLLSGTMPGAPAAASNTEKILRTLVVAVVFVGVTGLHFLYMLASNYSGLSDLSAEYGSKEKAAQFIDESLEIWPWNPLTTYRQSVLYAELFAKTGKKNMLEKSIVSARKSVKLNPCQPEYYAGLANLLEKAGNKADAHIAAAKAMKLYPVGIRYHTLYAHMKALDGHKEEALNIIENALKSADDYIRFKSPDGYDVLEAMFVKAAILNEIRQFDNALSTYEKMQEYVESGLVISPFSSSRHIKESVEGIKKRIDEFRNKTKTEKLKAEIDSGNQVDPLDKERPEVEP